MEKSPLEDSPPESSFSLKTSTNTSASWIGSLLNLIFPPSCLTCQRILSPEERGSFICTACQGSLGPVGWYCPWCEYQDLLINRCYCGEEGYRKPHYGLYWYQGVWKKAIIKFKYYNQLQLAKPLGKVLAASFLRDNDPSGSAVTFIPLHPAREKNRGYNQSFLLARELARALQLPLTPTLERKKNNSPQTSLSGQQRRENMKGVFAPLPPANELGEGPLLVVDDVLTTGATMTEAVKTLQQGTKRPVIGLLAAVQRHYSN